MPYPKVVSADVQPGDTQFLFVVPGQEIWRPRSVIATALTAAGGTPLRAYTLTFTDGTNTVAFTGASDAATDPATVTITWADVPSNVVTSGTIGISVAPIPRLVLNPGYTITGDFQNPQIGDVFQSAYVWYDYTPSGS